jgi:hypothetical protein
MKFYKIDPRSQQSAPMLRITTDGKAINSTAASVKWNIQVGPEQGPIFLTFIPRKIA